MVTLINRNGFYVKVNQFKPSTDQEIFDHIMSEICKASGYTPEQINSQSRKMEIRIWRQIGMYICVQKKFTTLSAIGKYFGFRDHSTTIAANARIQDLMDCNDSLVVEKMKMLNSLTHFAPSKRKPYGKA
jgi:chromosomal replication initiation ATPase DnaA